MQKQIEKMKHTTEIKEYLEHLDSNQPSENNCIVRTCYCLNWYSKKANWYKFLYHLFSIINVAVPLISSILITHFDGMELYVAILSAITSFSASLLSLLKVHEKWTNYRTAAEYLKKQYMLYITKTEPYDKLATRDSLYLSDIEKFMNDIHSKWYELQNSEKKA
uniref:DUF4231 domain-containing protein n=1 Tax=Agathobacter sp. TaxID=2021311 RepID=UPI0040565F65